MREWQPADQLNSWLVTIAITLVAFATRLVNLNFPNKLIFDETYYAKDAWTLSHLGYEGSWPEKIDGVEANAAVAAGSVDAFTTDPAFVVHPPLGKWIIAIGEQLFGMTSFGWRIMPCVFGALLIMLTIRLGRRLSRSTLIGAIAGIFLTFDGLTFVMSRVALLDIFQSVFLLAAVASCVADRDYYRAKIADKIEAARRPDLRGHFGPMVWLRPWRLLAGVMFGLAIAIKWTSLYPLAAMGILSVVWDVRARYLAGASKQAFWALLKDGIPAFARMVVVAVPVYLATWMSWFASSAGWGRNWGTENPGDPLTQTFGPDLAAWLNYHKEIYGFHTGDFMMLEADHPYEAHPLGWLIMWRPTAMDAQNGIEPGTEGCPLGQGECLRVITGLGTPVFWWLAAFAILACAILWLGDRDWRFGLPFLATMSMYLPWFLYAGRPTFHFYSITFVPYLAIGLALFLGAVLGPPGWPARRSRGIAVAVILTLVAANFVWIYPLLSDETLPRTLWQLRLWFGPLWI
ncbi:MAG: phospholipid carrier-dependent glycosyltransferase [Propionibacteriaceae bacterium]|nr:phospholipid carrier-dependent glycosyltransferase [Propionibacteriaceae bacterium]